jgi:hypothetical protein
VRVLLYLQVEVEGTNVILSQGSRREVVPYTCKSRPELVRVLWVKLNTREVVLYSCSDQPELVRVLRVQ